MAFDPHALPADDTLIILDVETTGLDHKTEAIIEIGAVRLEKGQVVDEFSTLVNPEQPIRPSSFKIHNISEEMVADAPTIAEVLPKFVDFVGELPYAGHSVVFDYSFITEAYKKHRGERFLNQRICTLEMFKSVFPEEHSHGLSALQARFNEENTDVSHRALDDAKMLAKVYPRLRKLYQQKHAWRYSQLGNVEYLLERYLRLQKAAQTLHSEMADLKDIFKLYFMEGGEPILASSGEHMSGQLKRHFDYSQDELSGILRDTPLFSRVSKVNLRTLDRYMNNGRAKELLEEEAFEKLQASRVGMTQSLSVNITRPNEAPVMISKTVKKRSKKSSADTAEPSETVPDGSQES